MNRWYEMTDEIRNWANSHLNAWIIGMLVGVVLGFIAALWLFGVI